jgi:hypothetical protein
MPAFPRIHRFIAMAFFVAVLLPQVGCNNPAAPANPIPEKDGAATKEPPKKELLKKQNTAKWATTPEEAFNALAEGYRTIDFEVLKGQLHSSSLAYVEMTENMIALNDTCKMKFGKSGPMLERFALEIEQERLKNYRFELKGQSTKNDKLVELTVWKTEKDGDNEKIEQSPWYAVKESMGWKIHKPVFLGVERERKLNEKQTIKIHTGVLPDDASNVRKNKRDIAGKLKLAEVIEEVRAGKYASSEAVEASLEAWSKAYEKKLQDDEDDESRNCQ